MTTANADNRRLYNIAAAVLLVMVAGSWLKTLVTAWQKPLSFDDAYMFARYATNMRHGLGMSWNLDGIHTYGETSPLWGIIVLAMSYSHLTAWKMLTLGSWLCSIAAVFAMAWAVAGNARSEMLSNTWRVLPWVALPLSITPVFTANQVNGMETMLAVLLASLFVGMAMRWQQGRARAVWVGLLGVLLFLARPDAALAVILFPLLLFFLMPRIPGSLRGTLTLLLVFLAGVALDLLACKLYFHTPLPLSFYMKSRHAYEGYHRTWYPEIIMMAFFGACQLYLVAMMFLSRRRDGRLIVCCLVPPLAVFAYLETVTQIMGFNARYYAPYLAFFIIPALLIADSWLLPSDQPPSQRWPGKSLLIRSSAAAILILSVTALSFDGINATVRRSEHRSHFEYDPVQFHIAANQPLPLIYWDEMMYYVTDFLVEPLPQDTTVAATEVGYLGSRAAHVNIIDLAGLNDNDIALHGFDTAALLARKPDLIWMPNTDYTFQNATILSDPSLLQQYDVYAGAANYGLAIRKDSPFRPQIDRQLQVFWHAAYPFYNMQDYAVQSATWSGQKHRVLGR